MQAICLLYYAIAPAPSMLFCLQYWGALTIIPVAMSGSRCCPLMLPAHLSCLHSSEWSLLPQAFQSGSHPLRLPPRSPNPRSLHLNPMGCCPSARMAYHQLLLLTLSLALSSLVPAAIASWCSYGDWLLHVLGVACSVPVSFGSQECSQVQLCFHYVKCYFAESVHSFFR